MADYPSRNELYVEYAFLDRAARIARRHPEGMGLKGSDASVNARFQKARDELKFAFTILLVASIEAHVRDHFTKAITDGEPRWLAVPGRTLNERQRGRPRFAEVFDLWKLAPDAVTTDPLLSAPDAIGKLKVLYARRHWLAHGRSWVDTSGYPNADPDAVMDAVDLIKRLIPSFPVE